MTNIHYSQERAASYDAHHAKSLRNRLTTWREQQCLRQALVMGAPLGRVLDLPCGTGRFADALAGLDFEHLTIADNSPGMLARAVTAFSADAQDESKLTALELSAFEIDLPQNSVDFIACMRFFHHLAYSEDRQRVLAEFRRISTGMVAISLWVDGNLGAWRRARKPPAERTTGFGRRRVIKRETIEAEFAVAGYEQVRVWDMWPGLTMWRQYLLRPR